MQKSLKLVDQLANAATFLTPIIEKHGSTVDTMKRAFWLEIQKNKKLQGCADESVVNAFRKCCEIGLVPGCDRLYLIPYGTACNVQIGVQGWLTLLNRSPEVSSAYSYAVYSNDHFSVSLGDSVAVEHKPFLNGDRGDLIGSYAIIKLKSKDFLFKYCDKGDLEKAKKTSQAYQTAVKFNKLESSPWHIYPEQMAEVTALRRLARKYANSLLGLDGLEAVYGEKGIDEQAPSPSYSVLWDEDGVIDVTPTNPVDMAEQYLDEGE